MFLKGETERATNDEHFWKCSEIYAVLIAKQNVFDKMLGRQINC